MTDQDRGAYTPQTEAPLAFDARVSHGGKPSQAPVMLIVSSVILAVLVIAMALFYRSGVRSLGQAPQVVGQPVGDVKAPPPPSAQPSNPGAGLQIYKSEATPAGEMKAPAFTPPPEDTAQRPAPRTEAPPAQASTPREAPARPQTETSEAPAARGLTIARPASPIAKAKGSTQAETVAETPVSAGHALVQIGAFSSPAVADKGWNDVAALLPGQMAGKTKSLEKTSKDGKTYYRTFVGGFASKEAASAFCASLKAAGKSCLVK